MAKRKNYTVEGEQQRSNAWMITFSDLVMLLLTFFVMLLAMSSMDTKKLKEIILHLRDSAGLLDFSGSMGVTDLASFVKKHKDTKAFFMIDQFLLRDLFGPSIELDREEMIKDLSELIDITDDERGIVLSLQENILFDSGEAKIKKESFPVLDSIFTAIDSCPNDILIMGHTDNIPSHSTLYESNWELSSYRALSVLEYFLKEKSRQPSRLSVGGYGPARPLYPNDVPKSRALNRRVEIIIRHL
jgi:chemotaxis protein MotB